jgi:sulfur relay (sulfurtransferase) complex TusBCD TusD component (DsrE family)
MINSYVQMFGTWNSKHNYLNAVRFCLTMEVQKGEKEQLLFPLSVGVCKCCSRYRGIVNNILRNYTYE